MDNLGLFHLGNMDMGKATAAFGGLCFVVDLRCLSGKLMDLASGYDMGRSGQGMQTHPLTGHYLT